MNNINRITRQALRVAAIALPLVGGWGLASCSDSWDDHYDQETANGTETLLKLVESDSQLSDFCAVLKATHLYNNNHPTTVTYADLLESDQTLTVWAPVNGSFNKDSLLQVASTQKGDSTVGVHFVANHIAHNLYNMNVNTDEYVKMFNNKSLTLTGDKFFESDVQSSNINIPATNGLLHVIEDDARYTYNVYEGLVTEQEFSHIGDFFARFEKQELDENSSIQSGIVDGKKVYSDSVMIKDNALFRVFENIMHEDSAYTMLVPSKEVWDEAHGQAAQYFNYGNVEKADSISEYWSNVALLRDLIYNRNEQRGDSLFSTSFSSREWPYHVYQNPTEAGNIMDPTNFKDSLLCSNGYIYRLKKWPFTPEQLYLKEINIQGERVSNVIDYDDCTFNYRKAVGDTISGNEYLDIVPKSTTINWAVTFEVRNTLSATYDIYAVVLPKTVYQANSRDFKPNKFTAELQYREADGKWKYITYKDEVTNDPYKVDTVYIGRATLPVTQYQQPDTDIALTLNCSVTRRQTAYSREMFLDCILFKPVNEEANTEEQLIKVRKEARK